MMILEVDAPIPRRPIPKYNELLGIAPGVRPDPRREHERRSSKRPYAGCTDFASSVKDGLFSIWLAPESKIAAAAASRRRRRQLRGRVPSRATRRPGAAYRLRAAVESLRPERDATGGTASGGSPPFVASRSGNCCSIVPLSTMSLLLLVHRTILSILCCSSPSLVCSLPAPWVVPPMRGLKVPPQDGIDRHSSVPRTPGPEPGRGVSGRAVRHKMKGLGRCQRHGSAAENPDRGESVSEIAASDTRTCFVDLQVHVDSLTCSSLRRQPASFQHGSISTSTTFSQRHSVDSRKERAVRVELDPTLVGRNVHVCMLRGIGKCVSSQCDPDG